MRRSVIYTAFVLGLLIYTGVSVATSTDYTKAVLNFATNMLIVIIGLQAVEWELDEKPICDRIPRAVKVFGPLVYIFVWVVTMLVVITGTKMIDSNVTDGTVAILNFTKNVVAVVVALAAANVMERAAKACVVVITLVMLFMALAFGLIAVVGL
ncbi:hypothetical protein PYWP30_01045 [Pyrobaculum sp. WP30]|nr:hypothetical protein PYWP30_01045 [Pyrobaculum sp. WP30]